MPFGVIDTATAPVIVGTFGTPQTSVGKTLATLRAEVLLKVKNRDDAAALVDGWINDAYRDVCAEVDFPELQGQVTFSTTRAQASYRLPAGAYTTKKLFLVDPSLANGGFPLVKTDEDAYRRFESSTDTPVQFFSYQNGSRRYLVLWPTPSAAFIMTLTFTVEPAPLTLATDSPILDQRWHRAIMLRAQYNMLDALDMNEEAAGALSAYLAHIRPKITKESQELKDQIMAISIPRRRSDLIRPPVR